MTGILDCWKGDSDRWLSTLDIKKKNVLNPFSVQDVLLSYFRKGILMRKKMRALRRSNNGGNCFRMVWFYHVNPENVSVMEELKK